MQRAPIVTKHTTRIEWDNERRAHVVHLMRDHVEVTVMPADDWADLTVNQFLADDGARQATHEAVTPANDEFKRLWVMDLAGVALADKPSAK